MDAQSNTQHPTHREDYHAPDWLVPDVALEFDLDPLRTLVTARLSVVRNGDHDRPLRLDGDGLRLLKLAVDGRALEPREDRKSVVEGKSVSVRVNLGGRRIIKKQ